MSDSDASLADAPLSPPDEEAGLWAALKRGSARARERLFSLHYPFARRLATRAFMNRHGRDIEFAEVCQLASVGLLEAIDRFDVGHGAPFTAYAVRRIKGAIADGVAKMNEVREQISFRRRARRERVSSLQDGAKVADPLDTLIELAVGLALGFMLEGTSLYVDAEQSAPLATAYDSAVWKEAMQRIATEVETLPAREQSILRYHYFDGLVFDQIGDLMGITKGRVSQLHRAALGLLKKRLSKSNPFSLQR